MKEKLYTIPLMDAFKAEDECPFCFVERQLEQHAMDFVLGAGASYMEDDVRAETDKMGFCRLFLYLQEHGSLLIPHKYSFRCFHWQCYKVSFLLTPSSICFQVFSTFPLFSTTKSVWARK